VIQNMQSNFALTQQYKFPDTYTKGIIDELMQVVLPSKIKWQIHELYCRLKSLLEKQHFELDRLLSNWPEKLEVQF